MVGSVCVTYGLLVWCCVVDVSNPWCIEVCLCFALIAVGFEMEKELG